MKAWAGTSGYSYKEWKGTFYPDKIPAKKMLSYYAERLPTVEINNTFYRMPKAEVLESWVEQVPDDFRFCLKASRRITHIKRLKACEDETEYLFRVLGELGPKLGIVLFQLPPNLKKDVERLASFLQLVPRGVKAAFEFRNESWFDESVFELLRAEGRGLVLMDDEEGATEPSRIISTCNWGYLRLRKPAYTRAELTDWKQRILAADWSEAYVFFKHEDEGAGPAMAKEFSALMAQ